MKIFGALLFSAIITTSAFAAGTPAKRSIGKVKMDMSRVADWNFNAWNAGTWSHAGPGWNRGWRAADSLLPGYNVPYYGDYYGGSYGRYKLEDNLEVLVTTRKASSCSSKYRSYDPSSEVHSRKDGPKRLCQ